MSLLFKLSLLVRLSFRPCFIKSVFKAESYNNLFPKGLVMSGLSLKAKALLFN